MQIPSENREFGEWWKARCSETAEREDQIVIMQFTGLYDRSGREIFEGDIVTYDSGSGIRERAVVRYLKQYVCFGVEEHTDLRDLNSIEVIGNIFENPEESAPACVFNATDNTYTLTYSAAGGSKILHH